MLLHFNTTSGRSSVFDMRLLSKSLLCCTFIVVLQSLGLSQERSERGSRLVVRDRVLPHWFANNDRFWYRVDLHDGVREFIVVDALLGQRTSAFDRLAVARAIGGDEAARSPIDEIEFDQATGQITLIGDKNFWVWDPTLQAIVRRGDAAELKPNAPVGDSQSNTRQNRTGAETEITFVNRMNITVEIFWVDGEGIRRSYGKVEPGTRKDQHTFGGHRWQVVTEKGESLGDVQANDTPSQIVIDGRKFEESQVSRRRSRREVPLTGRSPDGKWVATVNDSNISLRAAAGADTDEAMPLSTDGRVGAQYGALSWSPDSQSLVAFRIEAGDRIDVHLVRSSPEGGGRAQLHSRPYSLPGDKFPTYELNLFQIETRQQVKPTVDRFEHEWLRPELRWSRDGKRFTYEQVDRGHGRFRLIEIEVANASVRTLIDEKSETFIWTAHTENQDLKKVYWLDATDEIIYVTEKSGWRHLVMIDAITGQEKYPITSGDWIVRGIERIDEVARQVWFRASGCFDQDPYLIHYGRVNFDGSGLTWLTRGDGNHSLQYSPDRRFAVDTYSRVDMGSVSELRRMDDGQLVCELERADLSALEATGWRSPEVFRSKARDGITDIWGIICRPRDFDPTKKYPVIEDIYAGPHGSFVPKSFSPNQRYDALTQLGFIVVKIDGMGTANRSKAFQDVCWRNLKDAGLPDRILWMRAAATKYPEMDLGRVGIYGTSAGGQNAAAAVLFHPEFYKVAVSACGCHDNRMDKASWNEQWMGYPVGTHYSDCSNIDNAHRLLGKLLLIVGEMDTNVPPESTLRFADALIRAGKDFDLLVVPNAGHGMGGAYGQRRMQDYFVRHLLEQQPPDRNRPE